MSGEGRGGFRTVEHDMLLPIEAIGPMIEGEA